MRSLVLALVLAPAVAAQASPDKPTDAELGDWMLFLRSVSLPVTKDVCTRLLSGNADYSEAADKWLVAHEAEIARGRELAKAGLPKDRDFDQYHAAMAEDFRQKIVAKPEAAKLSLCTDSLKTLQNGVPGGGA